jgi:hypothetical protein
MAAISLIILPRLRVYAGTAADLQVLRRYLAQPDEEIQTAHMRGR